MANAALILCVLFFFAFVVGLFKPQMLLGSRNPKRRKLFLRFLFPSLILFLITGFLTNEENDRDWENPEGVTRLVLSNKDLTAMPERLKEFEILEELSLRNNQITELDEGILKSLPSLKLLNLENNPIEELPLWLADLVLERLELDGTRISVIPEELRQAIESIDYDNTPLALAEKETYEAMKDSLSGYPETESFGDFAFRKLIGKDYGYDKQFKKGTLYYTKGVPEDKIDSLGQFLMDNGYFTDDREISMQLKYNDQTGVKAYELRAVYSGGDEPLEDELYPIFELLSMMISQQVFDGMSVHFILTDDQFEESKYVFKSDSNQL